MQPQTILFDAVDFPRHWKPLLKLVRDKKPREEVIFLLVTASDFPMEDGAKAAHLGANGILGRNLSDKKELYRLEEIIRRYRSVRDKRNYTRLVPSGPGARRVRVHAPSSAFLRHGSRSRAFHPGIELSSRASPLPQRTFRWGSRFRTARSRWKTPLFPWTAS